MNNPKIALVTGGNRGIGFEICRQFALAKMRVVLTARNAGEGFESVTQLLNQGLNAVFHQLDVSDGISIGEAAVAVEKQYGRLDVLVNNAGIVVNHDSSLTVKKAAIQETLTTNFFGPFLMSRAFLPLLRKSQEGRIINVSSGMGVLKTMEGGSAAYRISKAALNALTANMAADLAETPIRVYAMCPGWVRTRLGGDTAPRSVEQGAETAVWLATEAGIPSGQFYRDKKPIDW